MRNEHNYKLLFSHGCLHRELEKKRFIILLSISILHRILTNSKNYHTDAFCGKLTVKRPLKIPPHRMHVATLPCEIVMSENNRALCSGELSVGPTYMYSCKTNSPD